MTHWLNTTLVVLIMINLSILGTSRIRAVIRMVAMQGVLLGMISLFVHPPLTISLVATSLVAVIIKAVVIPAIMMRALRDARIKREMEPLVGFLPSFFLGAVATGAALLFAGRLPLENAHFSSLLVPTSFATILIGFILLITRRKAISQVIGYLVLENGIFIFGLLLTETMPLAVELGVLLDLFVGIFVIGIILNHINQTFSSLDTRKLISLKE